MLCHGERVLGVALQAQMQCLDALQKQEGVEGRKRRAGITQSLHTRLEDEGQGAESLGIGEAVIGGVGLDEVALKRGEAPSRTCRHRR